MASNYTSFLQAPSTGQLADDASINYITTTTQINGAQEILKHLQAQQKQLDKKEEKVISTLESQDGVCIETETTLLFKTGGGVYLPGIDENLLDERIITFPMVHVVRFSGQGKIQQIRLYWDQGTLLKQVEVIGKSGRNWPIRDGKAQIAAITKSVSAYGHSNGAQSLPLRGPDDGAIGSKRQSVSATRDPHASLALFAPRDPNADTQSRSYNGPKQETRESARPAPREYSELFAGDEAPNPGSQLRSSSPSKAEGLVLKGNAGKYHVDNRLFDENAEPDLPRSPERKKTYEGKYEHFAFGDGEDAPSGQRPLAGKAGSKAPTHFSFEDFSTPPKVKEKSRPDHDRHWGAGVDEDQTSPAKRPIVHAPRPDADRHFQLSDNSPAAPEGKQKSFQRQKGMGLYQDPLHSDERTLANQFNVNSTRAGENFDSHYSMTDAAPMNQKKIYKTAGDGMGGKKGTDRRWGFGDDSDPDVPDAEVRASARSKSGRQTQAGAEY